MDLADDQTQIADEPVSVFLSYSRGDRAKALKIIAALEASDMRVWWDGMLEGGDAFAHSTESALETADAVVVLWSETSIQSHWVRDEATRGRDRGRMVPISLDGAQPPLGFRQIHYVDLSKWRGKVAAPEFAELLRAIRTTAGAPHQQLAFGSGMPAMRQLPRRHVLGLGIGAAAVMGGGLAAWKYGLFGAAAQINSVAILPFKNLSGDPAQEYFSDGLSEELRTTLSLNSQLEVAAETSSNSFRTSTADAKAIASALKVAFILEGSVRRSDKLLRIAAKLVDGTTGFEKWAQSFDRKQGDVLAVQSEIAAIVADALAVSMAVPARAGGTRDAAAFDAFLRGMALYKLAADEKSDRGALAAFDQAVRLDPKFAAAHAARSRAITVIAGTYGRSDELKALYQQAIDAANRAISLAPEMAEGHFALGFVMINGRLDVRAAQQPYQKSFELGYGNAGVLTAYGEYAANIGQFADGRRAIQRAQRLDPLNSSVFRSGGLLEFYARDYAAAEAALNSALAINAKSGVAHRILGDMLLLGGKVKEARDHYASEPFAILRMPGLAIADMRLAGRAAGELQLKAMIEEFGDNSLFQQAEVLAQWGQTGAALTALEKALAAGDPGLVQTRNDPLLDPIRHEGRFEAVLSKLGFT